MAIKRRLMEALEQPWHSLQLPVVGALALIVVSATLPWLWSKWIARRKPLPPGRSGFPILGETLEFLRMGRQNRLKDFCDARQQRYGEVFRTSLFGKQTISLPAPWGNKFLFTNEDSLVTNTAPSSELALLGKHSVSMLTGDDHKRTRAVLMAFLGPDALRRYVGRVCDVAEKHIADHWEGRSQVVAHALMRRFAFSVACSLLASLDNEHEQTKLIGPFEAFSAGIYEPHIDLPWTIYGKAKLGRLAIHKEFDRYIAERKKQLKEGTVSPDQDLLSSLLTIPDGNGNLLIDDAVKDNILVLLFAGHETTASALSSAFMFLSQNPDSLQQTLKEQLEIKHDKKDGEKLNWEDLQKMKYTWRVLQETLRMQPPALGAFRKAKVDFEFAGYSIPKGFQLFWAPGRSHHQEKFFPNPGKFDPSRFEGAPQPYTYIPFGGGPRLCPGMDFAKMEMLILLHYMVTRFVWSMMDPLEKVTALPISHPEKGLSITLCPR